MKIAIVTVIYKDTVEAFIRKHPAIHEYSYVEIKRLVDREISIWASGWEDALTPMGYEVFTIPINVPQLQYAWANEQNLQSRNLSVIAFHQIKQFQPDILWYDYFDFSFLQKIKSNVSSVRLVLGWSGSAIVDNHILREMNIVFSCAPETVQILSSQGIKAFHLHHAFNPTLLELIQPAQEHFPFVFIGQIVRGNSFHREREALLTELAQQFDLTIFSPSFNYGGKKMALMRLKKIIGKLLIPLVSIEKIKFKIETHNVLKEFLKFNNTQIVPYQRDLKKKMKPGVFGMEMLQILRNSEIVLNIHADSSPLYASNMRLFETTGVGACLLTDWKQNLHELYEIDTEIIAYKSKEECFEKVHWLLEHRTECKEIAVRGQKRVLKDHTYHTRAPILHNVIRQNL